MQNTGNLLLRYGLGFALIISSCNLKKAAKDVISDEKLRTDRMYVTFHTLEDTAFILNKFRRFELSIIDYQSHLNIVRMSYDSSKVSPATISSKLKKRKEISKVEFERNYNH